MAASDDYLVWVDMEMTGLDPTIDRVLEIAVLVTNGELEIVGEGPSLVIHQSDEVLNGMNDWNRDHHGKSGLTARSRESTVTELSAQHQVLDFLRPLVGQRKAPLAGNSIHQDRRFLVAYMPEVEAYVHYRNVDVSTIKELAKRWYPKVSAPPKAETHRALDDIRESIVELKFYRETVFRPSSPAAQPVV